MTGQADSPTIKTNWIDSKALRDRKDFDSLTDALWALRDLILTLNFVVVECQLVVHYTGSTVTLLRMRRALGGSVSAMDLA